MSNKRPLSPESTNGLNNDNHIRSLKRLKLHSIIQELRNEEANLVLLKKLRACQQSTTRVNNTSTTTTNGFHSTTKSNTPIPPPTLKTLQQPLPSATRKINPPITTKLPTSLPQKSSSTVSSLEERKTQAKKALRSQLERDLLNIPSPKPLIQDISCIPNPTSLEFQPYIGLEDVVQCLYELQMDRQRLPQRFTDRARVDDPNICEHCGTDFTIRWWKHLNTNTQQMNILCDRCKKQVTRRTLKSEHSTLLKNVFVSAMDQEKEIEKTFQTLIKQQQQKISSRPSTIPSKPIQTNSSITSIPTNNHNSKSKPRTSLPQTQNFATKLSQQSIPTNATRKSNVVLPPQVNRAIQYRSATAVPQQTKTNQMIKMPKTAVRQQQPVMPSRPLFPPTTGLVPPLTIHPSIPSSTNIRPTATKRRTLPPINMK